MANRPTPQNVDGEFDGVVGSHHYGVELDD